LSVELKAWKPAPFKRKALKFALRVIKLYQKMLAKNEYVISKQLLRSATSIGANVEEGRAGQSRKDFLSKMAVASKEARETKYWLRLIQESELTGIDVRGELNDIEELIRILTSIVKSTTQRR
jgi:four helix bundle protein